MGDEIFLKMWVDTERDRELNRKIKGDLRDGPITALIDQLYHLTDLDENGQHTVNRIHKFREDHDEQLNKEIKDRHVLEHQMQLWLKAYRDPEGWIDISYEHPVVKDPRTGRNRYVVNLDAKLSDYIFHDDDLKKDMLIIEAAYIPVMGRSIR